MNISYNVYDMAKNYVFIWIGILSRRKFVYEINFTRQPC